MNLGETGVFNKLGSHHKAVLVYHTGKPLVLESVRQDIEGDQRDLDVTVTFTPVAVL